MSKKVISVDFYTMDTLPERLSEIAKKQGAEIGSGVIAVIMTECCPSSYRFESVGTTADEIMSYVRRRASEEGIDLNEVARNLMSEPEYQSVGKR